MSAKKTLLKCLVVPDLILVQFVDSGEQREGIGKMLASLRVAEAFKRDKTECLPSCLRAKRAKILTLGGFDSKK